MESLSEELKVLREQQSKCLKRQEGILNRLSALQNSLPLRPPISRPNQDGEAGQFDEYRSKVDKLGKQLKETSCKEHHLQKTVDEYQNQIFDRYENVTDQMHCELRCVQETCSNLQKTIFMVKEDFTRTWLSSPSKLKDCQKRIRDKFAESGKHLPKEELLPSVKHVCNQKGGSKKSASNTWNVNKYKPVEFTKKDYFPMCLLDEELDTKHGANQTMVTKKLDLPAEQQSLESNFLSCAESMRQQSFSRSDTDEDFHNISSSYSNTDSDRSNTASPVQQTIPKKIVPSVEPEFLECLEASGSSGSDSIGIANTKPITEHYTPNTSDAASNKQQTAPKEVAFSPEPESLGHLGANSSSRLDEVIQTANRVSLVEETTQMGFAGSGNSGFQVLPGTTAMSRGPMDIKFDPSTHLGIPTLPNLQDGNMKHWMDSWHLLFSNSLSPENTNLQKLMEVFEGENNPPPRFHGMDTLLILDISESMAGTFLIQMKQYVYNFLSGLAVIQKQFNLKENVGLITIGHETKLQCHFTSDHSKIQNCVEGLTAGGKTPLLMGLILSVCEIESLGRRLSCGPHVVCPRILLLTDGKINTDDKSLGPDELEELDYVDQMERMQSKLFNFTDKLQKNRNPIHCIGVGNYNKEFLTALSESTGGHLYGKDETEKICHYQQYQVLVGRIHPGPMGTKSLDDPKCQNTAKVVLKTIEPRLTPSEVEEIIEMAIRASVLDQDHPIEKTEGGEEFPNLPSIGSRVRRGPEWKKENEDSNGVGTVTSHPSTKSLWVRWDNGNLGQYRYGMENQYEVLVVDEPRILLQSELIEVGVQVRRGPDWHYKNQDGSPGNIGVVYKKTKDGQVKVRWPNGYQDIYNYGKGGTFDLEIVTEFEFGVKPESSVPKPVNKSQEKAVHQEQDMFDISESQDKSEVVWQWLDDSGNYRTYIPAIIKQIEQEYSSNPSGSVTLTFVGNKPFKTSKIIFTRLVQEEFGGKDRRVRRVSCTMDEYHRHLQEEMKLGH